MISHVDRGHSARLVCLDALEREFDVLCFAGAGLCSLNLSRTVDRRLHLTPLGARQLAHVLDHFGRHHTLPHAPQACEDWSI